MRPTGEILEQMSLDELRTLARRLGLSGYSSRRKTELVALIRSVDSALLQKHLFPTWWQCYHNHVYGAVTVIGFVLSIAFFIWPTTETPTTARQPKDALGRPTVEQPIRFADYAALPPSEKQSLLRERIGEQFIWEGFLATTSGFELGTQTGVPYDTPVSIEIVPTTSATPQLRAECRFGEIHPTDSGVELAIQLNWLSPGQRIRVAGLLAGNPEEPVLHDAWLEAVFPVGE
jgi:hypothetical protein